MNEAPKPTVPAASEAPGLKSIPGWERWPWLRAAFSTRPGGFSTVYRRDNELGEQNLGWTPQDDAGTVSAARTRFLAKVSGGTHLDLVTTRQFHSGVVSVIEAGHGPLRYDERNSALWGDGLVTNLPGLLLGVITADCVPVLVADTRSHAVAAFHAGWRGTLSGIVERGVATMSSRFGSRPEDLIAAVGPAIGSCCFAVGEDMRSHFASRFVYAPLLFSVIQDSDIMPEADVSGPPPAGRLHMDLHEANRRQLLEAGVRVEAVQVLGECTACTRLPDGRRKYFSHRSEQGFTGRMLSVIGAAE